MEKRQSEKDKLLNQQSDISFGHQIRTYTESPTAIVKDHRTNIEKNNFDKVLDGEINDFIQNRRLYKSFILAAVNVRIEKEANIAVELSDKEQEFYDLIMSDLKKIDDFLNNLNIKITQNNDNINGYSVFCSVVPPYNWSSQK